MTTRPTAPTMDQRVRIASTAALARPQDQRVGRGPLLSFAEFVATLNRAN
jgi:hypothetical protein